MLDARIMRETMALNGCRQKVQNKMCREGDAPDLATIQ